MEQTNSTFLSGLLSTSLLCFIFFFMSSLELITTAKGNPSLVLTNKTDHQALLAIKDLIQGDPWGALSSWNHSIHFCNWQGISCSRRHQRVTALNLSSLALVGSVSPQIGNLTFLRRIDLGNNSFHGEIPQELGKLFRLQYLLLLNNSFQGEFPTNLTHCSHLRYIDMRDNHLGGKIPTELGFLSNLSKLNLATNHLTGTIPLSIGNLSNLRELSLGFNNLEGSIPTQLGQLSKLEFLQLSVNNLSGMVPTSLYNISSIYLFFISSNQLHGILPPNLGLTLPNLQEFYVFSNQFYGQIPSSLVNATRLAYINFGRNSFTGPMPMNLGTLDALAGVGASDNSLGTNQANELMSFLTSLSNCSNLQVLDLALNYFKGFLPHSIANLSTNITWFSLQANYISGNIPFGIGNHVNLRYLFLSQNLLTDSIPNSIGKLSMLERLLLQYNNISREIPSSIRNLSRLGVLDLSTNMIEGSIPISLGNCTNLQQICLDYNHLTGAIPYQIFGLSSLISLSLNQNYLIGLLPQEVGNLKNLGGLYVSKNKLFGEIPATLGNCEVLEFLYIDGNLFEGTIPMAFRQLRGIQELGVSRNNLCGQIPRFLGEFRFFQYLNLSYNMFDGEVPNEGVFTNISAFSVVGNSKLCGGIKLLQLPACPMQVLNERKRLFNHRVIVLIVTLTIVLLSLFILAIIYRNKTSRQQVKLASPLQNQYLQLSFGELFQATNGFSPSNLIGEGRYGSVYKGILNSDEQIIAVKVFKLHECGANKSFVTECEALKNIRNRNLVKIITACSSIDFKGNDFKALVFEFMENGSLENWLHLLLEPHEPKNLNFVQRLNIAIDVACALDYLHHHCEMAFIHCDLKPSNILLDGDLCAHVSDFGLAKIFSVTNGISIHQQSSSTGIRGTIGYVAPEYGMGEEVSMQGDMYSYGVLLLEIFTGKRPTNNMFMGNVNLHSYVQMCLPGKVMQIIDPQIILEMEEEPSRSMQRSTTNISKLEVCLVPVFQIGVSCSAEMPSERMSVKDVLKELHKIRTVFLGVRGQRH
ncbi:probable LRR receptor-like serine/threonine-protein kinase At3g47570 [Camellia sinensis]|uniref:probable LRR receptor-like serine/threonine-protein kinase At3g47570 n=1 Tax=Camellia sinensis TaxID=4442 RepID=UPI0010367106|nr:probable LRR receptor-like serine/threonine-protein kinase At3g47570 [Camellia sinensis]